jgi:gamma-glutamylcyclotransferase (GGCT)/AIG2-like uncharacterized protein YtfP
MASWLDYFAYGSNLHPRRLRDRTPSVQFQCTAWLARHRLAFHKRGADGSGKADVVTGSEEDRVHGAVYRMSARDATRLDRIEGLGAGYDRKTVAVITPLGPRLVFCYQAMPAWVLPGLVPFSWYRELVVAGARYHDLPDRYVRRIRSTPCEPDPDPVRAAAHLELLRGPL